MPQGHRIDTRQTDGLQDRLMPPAFLVVGIIKRLSSWFDGVYCGCVRVRFEKMISGMYLGELARLIIMQCANAKLLFDGKTSAELQTPGRFYTKYISEIEKYVTVSLHVCVHSSLNSLKEQV